MSSSKEEAIKHPMSTTISDCCASGHLHEGEPNGREEKVNGLDCYITEPEDGDRRLVVLFITDIFGYKLKNSKLLADEYAKAGYYVYMPDFHQGDSLPESLLNKIAPSETAEPKSFFTKITDTASAIVQFGPWLFRHRDGVTKPLIESFISYIKNNTEHQKIALVGFCWGGRHAIVFAQNPPITCSVACHPSNVSLPSEVYPVSAPTAIYAGSEDSMFPPSSCDTAKEVFEKLGIQYDVRVFEGQTHGFAVRGDLTKEAINNAKEECTKATIAWFDKFMKK
ncbi:hypothetical protein YB2330_004318 [Saitoella coloradoensis]